MRYAFGECVFDTERHELCRAGAPVKLQRKVYQVLAYLVEHRDRLVTKEDPLEHIWAGVYVEDYAVARGIAAVRRGVGDSRDTQRVIQTLHGQGYRFVAEVVEEAPFEATPGPIPTPHQLEIQPTSPWGTAVGERKLVTVLCCRWAPMPSPAGHLDLDNWHEWLQAVEACVRDVVQPFGGLLQPPAHDGAEVVCGAPVAQEDHASRAVLAALALQQQWQNLRAELGLPCQAVLPLQIGLHTGLVVVEVHGGEASHRMSIVGEVPTLAAALAQQAAPGSIVVSATVARLLPEEMDLEAVPPVPGMGQATPVAAYRLVGYGAGRALRGRPRKDWSSPFVGRDEELATLHRLLGRVREGQGQVVGIVGEPGIGKTRLLVEFQQSLAEQPVKYLLGRCQSYREATPYLALAHLLWQQWGLTDADSLTIRRAKVQAGLHRMGLDVDTAAPAVLDLLGLAEATEPWGSLSPQARKGRIFATLHQLFLDGSQVQPLVVEVENLHWADPSTEEYLAALVARLSGAKILLLVTYRPGYRPPWIVSSIATQISLQPLAPFHSRRLVQAALGQQSLPGAVLQQILTKAGGNPLFLEELTLAVREQSDTTRTAAVPDTMQAVLAARTDRLPPVAKYLLQTAAVIGPEVPEPLLRALVTLPETVLAESLTQLQTSEFLFETRAFPTSTYTFKHALTQEVAYQSLLRRTRRQLHAQIVQVVRERFPELAEAQPERLAHHATEAGLHAQAVTFWLQASQHAVERSANQEAVSHLTKGLDVLQAIPETSERTQQELMLHIALGAALLMTEGHAAPVIQRAYARAYELCQQVEETPQLASVLLGLWRFYLVRGELAQARVLSERLLSLARRLQDPSLLILADYTLGTT
jgi:DNA-binding winged helix-turn-helix (wHTH) protein